MIIKNVEKFLVGAKMAISKYFGVFLRFKPPFCQSVPTNPTKVAEQEFLGVLQHPAKVKAKIFAGKFYL